MARINAAAKALQDEGAIVHTSVEDGEFKITVTGADSEKKLYEGTSVTEALKKLHAHRDQAEQDTILAQWKYLKAQAVTGKIQPDQDEIDAQD